MIMKELVIREYVMFKFSIKVRIEIIVNENTKKNDNTLNIVFLYIVPKQTTLIYFY